MNATLSPKWHAFQEALARLLKTSLAVVTPTGMIQVIYNPLPPYTEISDYPLLMEAYSLFFKNLPQVCGAPAHNRIVADPLGLPTAVLSLDDGSFLVMGGGLDKTNTCSMANLREKLQQYEASDENQRWLRLSSLSPEEFRSSFEHVVTLYNQIFRSFGETTELGQQRLVLSAVDDINKLMVGLLHSKNFDLCRILDLVASSLVILSDGEGAWAFTYQHPGQSLEQCRGMCVEVLEPLRQKWQEIAARQEDPLDLFIPPYEDFICGTHNLVACTEKHQGQDSSACLGVIAPNGPHIQSALSAFTRQVVIALEVSSLYQVLQKQIGMLCNSVRHGMIITNRQGDVLLINEAAQAIVRSQAIVLIPGDPLAGSGFYRPMEEAALEVIATGFAHTQMRSTVGKGDNLLHLRWDVLPLATEEGVVTGAILLFEDITEQVNLFREVRDWEKLATAGEVAAGLAHEIRNPLATAKAAIQLYELIDDQTKRIELMRKLDGELDRMNEVLTTFLSLTKPVKDECFKVVNPKSILLELEFLMRGEAHLNEIDLILEMPDTDICQVMSDANSLKQVFFNIARNAIEAMPGGGVLKISLRQQDEHVHICFCDNGSGIPENIIQNITRPFFTTKLGGTGLGLSISSSILNMMGGVLRINSKPGADTVVEIVLPRRVEQRLKKG